MCRAAPASAYLDTALLGEVGSVNGEADAKGGV